jgi:hypothetical protein
MNFSKNLLTVTAALFPALIAGNAFAQATGAATANVEVRATVAADFTVNPGPAVDLGTVFQGTIDDVLSDGTSVYGAAAQFDITGPSSIDWLVTVAYNALAGPGPEVITLSAPGAGNQICFQAGAPVFPPTCDGAASGPSPLTIPQANHGGAGTAWVGFNFNVPNPATLGAYSAANAVVLTAEGILGS